MASERRSRFKDNVRAGMRRHEEALDSTPAEGEAPPEGESAGGNAPEAEGRKPAKKKELAAKSTGPAKKKTEAKGNDAKTAVKPKGAKAIRKPAKKKGETTEADPFAKDDARETKTRRVNLLLRESDLAAWREAAEEREVSLTVFIEKVVNSYLDR